MKSPLKNIESRLSKIDNVLLSYSNGDFTKQLTLSSELDPIDIIMSGINMLGEELRDVSISKNFFNAAFNSVTDSLIVINAQGEILDYNNSFMSILEYQYIDLKGKLITEIVKIDNLSQQLKKIDKDLNVHTYQSEIITENRTIVVECSLSSVDPDKKLYLIKLQDLTDKINEEARRIATIIKTQEEERNRVASDLHDSVGQQISALKFFINAIQSQKDEKVKGELFKKTQKIINGVADEIRNICFQLMPRSIERFGLIKTVEQLADLIQFSTQITFNLNLQTKEIRLDSNLAMSVYRIVQEFINNSVKHSRCNQIDIEIKIEKQSLFIKMSDDGIGFDMENLIKGNGLDNMNLRVNYLKGDIKLVSQKKKGVLLEINIPLQ
ncbi:MAG: PAS domain-containing sensor histidine kinase [Bacteroidota bacterium]|nr:PAS domain-containing sensor histidine kinase [Bacteroidota bacterium]